MLVATHSWNRAASGGSVASSLGINELLAWVQEWLAADQSSVSGPLEYLFRLARAFVTPEVVDAVVLNDSWVQFLDAVLPSASSVQVIKLLRTVHGLRLVMKIGVIDKRLLAHKVGDGWQICGGSDSGTLVDWRCQPLDQLALRLSGQLLAASAAAEANISSPSVFVSDLRLLELLLRGTGTQGMAGCHSRSFAISSCC